MQPILKDIIQGLKIGTTILATAGLISLSDNTNTQTKVQNSPQINSPEFYHVGLPEQKRKLPSNEKFAFTYSGYGYRILTEEELHFQYREGLKAVSQFRDLIENSKYDPIFMTAMIVVESSGNMFAKSPTGPLGLGQFAKATGIRSGLVIDSHIDERLNPEKSIRAIERHLDEIIEMYGGIDEIYIDDLVIYRDYKEITREKVLYTYYQGQKLNDFNNILVKPRNHFIAVGGLIKLLEKGSLNLDLEVPLYSNRYLQGVLSYFVEKGDSFDRIARNFEIPREEIKYANPEVKKLSPGMEIKIPKNSN